MMIDNKERAEKMKATMEKLAESLGMKSVVRKVPGSGSLSYFMDDEN